MSSWLRWKSRKKNKSFSKLCNQINPGRGVGNLSGTPPNFYFMEVMPMKKSPVGKVAEQAIVTKLKNKPLYPTNKINVNHASKGVCEYAFK